MLETEKRGMPSVRRSIYQVMRASKYQMHLGNRIRQTYDHIPGTPFERHAYVLVEGDKPNRYFLWMPHGVPVLSTMEHSPVAMMICHGSIPHPYGWHSHIFPMKKNIKC